MDIGRRRPSLAARLHHPEVRRVDWRPILGNLREQPIQEFEGEERVPLEAVLAEGNARSQHLDIDEPGLPPRFDQRLLRKRAGQSTRVGGFVFQDLLGQTSVDHRVRKYQPAAGS